MNPTPAQQALLRMMEWYSEETYAASWYHGIEDILIHRGIARYPDDPDMQALAWLIEQAGGIWRWDRGDTEPHFEATVTAREGA